MEAQATLAGPPPREPARDGARVEDVLRRPGHDDHGSRDRGDVAVAGVRPVARRPGAEASMPKAIRFHAQGGPEVLRYEDVRGRRAGARPGPPPAHGHRRQLPRHLSAVRALSRATAVRRRQRGRRRGGGGRDGVTDLAAGDRVAYTGLPGAYAEARLAPAERLVKLPAGISDEQAASMMLKGLTVHYLIHSTYPVKTGETVLWHAAAGGVGLIACQWLRSLGVTVIGTAGSDEKTALAKAHGATHVVNYTPRGLRGAGEGHHRRREGAGGLRLGGQGDVGRLARLPAAARHHGLVRQRVRPRAAGQHRHPRRPRARCT